MKTFLIFLTATLLFFNTGCSTTVGRFVTNVSSGSPGTLSVERCELQREIWTGSLNVTDCETSPVGIGGQ
jgi:hypothetical protein